MHDNAHMGGGNCLCAISQGFNGHDNTVCLVESGIQLIDRQRTRIGCGSHLLYTIVRIRFFTSHKTNTEHQQGCKE